MPLLCAASIAALALFYSRNEILLSGDAVAHINIARRVVDSRTPGLLQLGSVWLPLPHLLTVPFVLSRWLWMTGLGGSVVSCASYVLSGLGLFRLLSRFSRTAAWVGTAMFAGNPNLLYVQTTALNEPLFLACFVWGVVFFSEAWFSLRADAVSAAKSLEKGAIVLAGGILTRYDGWFLAALCWAAILPSLINAVGNESLRKKILGSICRALLLTLLAPTLWLAYNFGVYGNALDFATGPYSAKAIAERTTPKDAPPYPGEHHLFTAALYFAKAAQLNIANSAAAKLVVWIAAVVSLVFAIRRSWIVPLLLWSPLAFYALSIAYGSVPIFLPVWWPFSYYNARYGLELLPAIAFGMGAAIDLFAGRQPRRLCSAAVLMSAVFCYISALRTIPICLHEVQANGTARLKLDSKLARVLKTLPRDATVLAYTGGHSGAFEMAGFPFRHTISEGNFRVWESALAHPADWANYVIAADDDPVAATARSHREELLQVAHIDVPGQAAVTVYKTAGSCRLRRSC